jgi:hypothetical protein
VPLNPDYLKRLRDVAAAVDSTPFTVLVWGPGIPATSAQGRKREKIKAFLQSVLGPAATVIFSEDLVGQVDELAERDDLVAEYIQLRAADAVVLIPESIGSVTESALFSVELRAKCIAFVQRREGSSFAKKAYGTLKVETVEREEWEECSRVTRAARDYVEQLRLEKFKKSSAASGFDWER